MAVIASTDLPWLPSLTGFIALAFEGLSAPTLAVTIGAFLSFAPGVIAYWFAGTGRTAMGGAGKGPIDGLGGHMPMIPTGAAGAGVG